MEKFNTKKKKNKHNMRRYLERNEEFNNFQIGNLVEIDFENGLFQKRIRLRKVLKTEEGFRYIDCGKPKIESWEMFGAGIVGIFLGRYDGFVVAMFEANLYSVPVTCLKKIEYK